MPAEGQVLLKGERMVGSPRCSAVLPVGQPDVAPTPPPDLAGGSVGSRRCSRAGSTARPRSDPALSWPPSLVPRAPGEQLPQVGGDQPLDSEASGQVTGAQEATDFPLSWKVCSVLPQAVDVGSRLCKGILSGFRSSRIPCPVSHQGLQGTSYCLLSWSH